MVYMRGGIDIKALLTGDADFGTGSTTAVTAFVAGAPLRVVMSMNAFVDQALYAQPKYRNLAQLKGQSIGSLNPGGLVDTLLRRIIVQGMVSHRSAISLLLNMGGTPERYAALKSGTLAASMLSAPHSLRAEKDGFTQDRRHPRLCRRSRHGLRHPRRQNQKAAEHDQTIHARLPARDELHPRQPRRHHADDRARVRHGPGDRRAGVQSNCSNS